VCGVEVYLNLSFKRSGGAMDVQTNVKEAHLALDRDRTNRRQSLDEQKRLKAENIQKEILENRQSNTFDPSEGFGSERPSESGPLDSKSRKFLGKATNDTQEMFYKRIISRNLTHESRKENVALEDDICDLNTLNGLEKIDFMSSWYDTIREGNKFEEGVETSEQFLNSFAISRETCSEEEWREWILALSKSAAYDRSSRRRSSSAAPPRLPLQSNGHGDQPQDRERAEGEVVVPIKRESVADIRRKFTSRSKLETESEFQRFVLRNLTLTSRAENSSHLMEDCESARSMSSSQKIDLLTTWYEILREKREEDERFEHTESPEEFLLSLGVTKEACGEDQWREWIIALSKSAASERSSQRRRSSSSRKLVCPGERSSFTKGDDTTLLASPPAAVVATVEAESKDPPSSPSPPNPPPLDSVLSSTQSPKEFSVSPLSSQDTHFVTPPPSRSPSASSPRDDFHSQVIPSSPSSFSAPIEYKKSLSAASVVFPQAPDEDRESLWSNVELSFSDVVQTSAQTSSSYLQSPPSSHSPESGKNDGVVSPMHSNCHHISIDNDPRQRDPPQDRCCCRIA
jgi:hypothetical protein